MATKLGQSLLGAGYGVLPGAFMVAIAQFVITGEWQLTIGAFGLVFAAAGLIAGGLIGYDRGK